MPKRDDKGSLGRKSRQDTVRIEPTLPTSCRPKSRSHLAAVGNESGAFDHEAKTIGAHEPSRQEMEASASDGTIVSTSLGRLMVKRMLGKGSFGAVYLAESIESKTTLSSPTEPDRSTAVSLPKRCAIKIFHRTSTRLIETLVKRELAALKVLSSERIPPLLTYDFARAPYYIVTPFYPDGSLADRPNRASPLPEVEAWTLLLHLLEAIRDAHKCSILHLDIKPENILRDGKGGYLLADFGIAQGSLDFQQKQGTGLGTPGYQAPEQRMYRIGEIDMRTDVFGIGITLWYLLTGIHPTLEFLATMHTAIKSGAKRPIPATAEAANGISAKLAGLIDQMTNTRNSDRPPSAADILSQIDLASVLNSRTTDNARELTTKEKIELLESLADSSIVSLLLKKPSRGAAVRLYEQGTALGLAGDTAYTAFMLLKGKVRIEREGVFLNAEDREGAFLGEVGALTFESRTASMIAETNVIVLKVDASELEHFIADYPSVALRMMRSLAHQVVRESRRDRTEKETLMS